MKIYGTGPVGLIKVQMQKKQTLFPYSLMRKLKTKSFALPASYLENTCLVSVFILLQCLVQFCLDYHLWSSRHSPTSTQTGKTESGFSVQLQGLQISLLPSILHRFWKSREGSVNERWAAALGCGGAADQQPSICVTLFVPGSAVHCIWDFFGCLFNFIFLWDKWRQKEGASCS